MKKKFEHKNVNSFLLICCMDESFQDYSWIQDIEADLS